MQAMWRWRSKCGLNQLGSYQKAVQLAPAFGLAGAKRTLALYAGNQTNKDM